MEHKVAKRMGNAKMVRCWSLDAVLDESFIFEGVPAVDYLAVPDVDKIDRRKFRRGKDNGCGRYRLRGSRR